MIHHHNRPRGPTDKASDYESGDCGFESHRGCIFFWFLICTEHNSEKKINDKTQQGARGESNPRPLAPEARIIPLDHPPVDTFALCSILR